MYGCGGDRRFFKENGIHPAEFLRAAWAYEDAESKLIDWVVARKARVVDKCQKTITYPLYEY